MLPQQHIIFGFFLAIVIFSILPSIGLFGFFLIFLSSFLLDADHYIYYIFKKRNFNLSKAYSFFIDNRKKFLALPIEKRANYLDIWCFFHGLEIPLVCFILTFLLSYYFSFLFIGASFHLLFDYYEQWPLSKRKDKISIIYYFLKFKKLEKLHEKINF